MLEVGESGLCLSSSLAIRVYIKTFMVRSSVVFCDAQVCSGLFPSRAAFGLRRYLDGTAKRSTYLENASVNIVCHQQVESGP